MIKGGIELYLDWVNLSRERDRIIDECTTKFSSFLCERAVAIFERVRFNHDEDAIAENELGPYCLDADDVNTIIDYVTFMTESDFFCNLVYEVSLFWCMTEYVVLFEQLVLLKAECMAVGNQIMQLYMMRGIWKTFLGKWDDFELLEAFTSSHDGLCALGIEADSKILLYAHQTVQCYKNKTLCRNCLKRITNNGRRVVCANCRAVWFCDTHCMNATKDDSYCGHFHECDLLK